MSRAFVTGHTGFFGAAIAKCLTRRGWEVHGTTTASGDDKLHPCNIRDRARVETLVSRLAPDLIVHCAAIAGVTGVPAMDYYETNVIGTDNVVNAATRIGKRIRLMHISTAGVYGNQPFQYLDESLEPAPVQHYGLSKYCAERLVQVRSEDFDSTIVRPFNIIGVGQSENFIVPKLVAAFAAGRPQVKLGNIDVFRDYIDLELAATTLCDLVENSESSGEVVNLCTGVGTSLRELLVRLGEIAGYEIEVVVAPEFVRKNEVWKLLGSRDKLDRLLRRPLAVKPVEATLREMFQHARGKRA